MGISGCTYIRNAIDGAFCLFESMASMLPFVDEICVLDLGSTDGTRDILFDIAASNKKIRIDSGKYSKIDASAFADAASDVIAMAKFDTVLLWQADEIWHEKLLIRMEQYIEDGQRDLAFWRIQLKNNFQEVKWHPHPVHRLAPKDDFHFVGDGMNTERVYSVPICSDYDLDWHYKKWEELNPVDLPLSQMILDVSMNGGFRDNVVRRSELHAPMWQETPNVGGQPSDEWHAEALQNPDWTKETTPFDIPKIMRWHVGRVIYDVRPELIEALKNDDTREMLGYELHTESD